ncbi:urease subunit alpha [Spongiactinospora rosea]|uniref:Urease subunit alpha n=1 Tax=Spongiactinospora rosea TaxID=2248750 RepID=A0A366M0R9_9ACTN|nr:urease subunit alpha [Spongiactinospora rosea]RBQ19164.1 urease subunit alpha [Spongiactinospora rosea]
MTDRNTAGGGADERPAWLERLQTGQRAQAPTPLETPRTIEPRDYVDYFGPTVGDGVRLADTDIVITVEADFSRGRFGSGNEAVFGGGKVIRESMGQSNVRQSTAGTPDTLITGALILDHWGIVKADVALKDGKIHAIGKAGNPLIMSDVHSATGLPVETHTGDPVSDLTIGPETEIIAGNGKILTAGAIDTHVHFLLPGLAAHALSGGTTTCVGGGTGMATGSLATTVTPGPWNIGQAIRAMDAFPLNVGLLGKGAAAAGRSLADQARAGACGYKIHEDWGATPMALRDTLAAAQEHGMQVSLHADTLNEAGFFQYSKQIIQQSGRSIHSFHTEGAGGGHAPDILRMASLPQVLPASTNPTLPLTKNTTPEALWMVILAHHLNPGVPTDMAFAESRVRVHTTFAENVLHDFGALSITSSDALAMGRIGELTMRTWQTAHVMKSHWRTVGFPSLDQTGGVDMSDDNQRARRYIAKYTINPAIAQGMDHRIGSIEAGKDADLVLWDPRFFGVRAEMVLQRGVQVWAVCGDPAAAVTQPEPYWGRPNWGASGTSVAACTRMFVSPAAGTGNPDGTLTPHEPLGTGKPWVAVRPTGALRKEHMKNNATLPDIQVGVSRDRGAADSYVVTIDGVEYPAPHDLPEVIPMTQRYSLF